MLSPVPFASFCEHPARNQAMYMNMATQVLPPSMEDSGHAQLSLQVFGSEAKLTERAPNRLEKATVDHIWMHLHPAVQGMR